MQMGDEFDGDGLSQGILLLTPYEVSALILRPIDVSGW